jgi:DNA-binding LytR/AlgR family response regulator
VIIHTTDKKNITHRSTFSEFLSQLPAGKFFRIHRSFAVQTELIENIGNTEVTIAGISIPISNTYREELYSHLGIKQ